MFNEEDLIDSELVLEVLREHLITCESDYDIAKANRKTYQAKECLGRIWGLHIALKCIEDNKI